MAPAFIPPPLEAEVIDPQTKRFSLPWSGWFQKLSIFPEPFKTYTPVITAGSGAFTTVSATGRYRIIGKLIFFQISVTITTNGTAAGQVNVSLPFAALNVVDALYTIYGRANAISSKQLQGIIGAGASTLSILNYDGSYPGASGEKLYVSGFYEVG